MSKVVQEATVTSKGQVTIPVDMRRALGITDGGPVVFTLGEGELMLRSARKPSLSVAGGIKARKFVE